MISQETQLVGVVIVLSVLFFLSPKISLTMFTVALPALLAVSNLKMLVFPFVQLDLIKV